MINPTIKIVNKNGEFRYTSKEETERLRGIHWEQCHEFFKGQRLWGTKLLVTFESYDKRNQEVILQEHSKEDIVGKESDFVKKERHKEELSKVPKVVLSKEEQESLKREKVITFTGMLEELKMSSDWSYLEQKGFQIKVVGGIGIYYLVNCPSNTELEYNILVESGYVSYKEESIKDKTVTRKYKPICNGVMESKECLKSLAFIKKHIGTI